MTIMIKKIRIKLLITLFIVIISAVIFLAWYLFVKSNNSNIIVLSPKTGSTIESPLTIKGKTGIFEKDIVYILRGENGSELHKDHSKAKMPKIGRQWRYGGFEIKIPIPAQSSNKLTLEVFTYSAKSGSVENLVSIPLTLATNETTDIEIYLTNSGLGSETDCAKVSPIKRQIMKTKEPEYMAAYQLLQGPNMGELGEGYDTAISGQAGINSIIIRGDTAYADFNEGLEYGIASDCQAAAIKSQIETTLKQFPSVKNVVISINGRTF